MTETHTLVEQPPRRSVAVVSSSTGAEKQYLYGVQGLRTVAALMVAIYHIWFGRVSGGVDVFFVVAGYFAANSLLRATSQPTTRARLVGVGQYILRTARRVIPSAAVVVVGTVIAGWLFLPRSQWESVIPHGWASLAFRENWYLIETGNDYLQGGLAASPFQQFWALSLQAQSYVVFPMVALLAAVGGRFVRGSLRRVFFLFVAAVFASSLTYSVLLTASDQPVAYFHLGTRLWEFAAGTGLALILRRPVGNPAVMRVLGWCGLLAVVFFAAVVDASQLLPGFVALVPVTAGALIIAASGHGVEPSILRARPVLWFADSSFAFYLWHWPVLVFYRWQFGQDVSLKGGLAIIVLSALMAVATTKLVEVPVRTSPLLKRSTVATVVACLLLLTPPAVALGVWNVRNASEQASDWQAVEAVLGGAPIGEGKFVPSTAIAGRDLSKAYERECQQGTKGAEVITCEWGNTSAETTIALVGASHDTQWIDLVARTADELDVRLVTMTKGSCPLGDMTATDFDVDPSCPEWMAAMMARLVGDPPDLVITTVTRTGSDGEEVPAWKTPNLQQLSAAGIPVLGLRDSPQFGFNVPACIDARGVERCGLNRAHVLTPVDQLEVPNFPGFTFVDTVKDYCTDDICPAVKDGLLMSWDGSHLTRTWTLVHGGTIRTAVIEALRGPI